MSNLTRVNRGFALGVGGDGAVAINLDLLVRWLTGNENLITSTVPGVTAAAGVEAK